eukprot:5338607-Prymnesium_polylepis.1
MAAASLQLAHGCADRVRGVRARLGGVRAEARRRRRLVSMCVEQQLQQLDSGRLLARDPEVPAILGRARAILGRLRARDPEVPARAWGPRGVAWGPCGVTWGVTWGRVARTWNRRRAARAGIR